MLDLKNSKSEIVKAFFNSLLALAQASGKGNNTFRSIFFDANGNIVATNGFTLAILKGCVTPEQLQELGIGEDGLMFLPDSYTKLSSKRVPIQLDYEKNEDGLIRTRIIADKVIMGSVYDSRYPNYERITKDLGMMCDPSESVRVSPHQLVIWATPLLKELGKDDFGNSTYLGPKGARYPTLANWEFDGGQGVTYEIYQCLLRVA